MKNRKTLNILLYCEDGALQSSLTSMLSEGALYHYALFDKTTAVNVKSFDLALVEEAFKYKIRSLNMPATPMMLITEKECDICPTVASHIYEYLPKEVLCKPVLEHMIHHCLLEKTLKAKLKKAEAKIEQSNHKNQDLVAALNHQGTYDQITDLINRQAFIDAVKHELQHKMHKNFAIMLLDISGFQTINDALGHEQGDTILKLVAKRIQSALRAEDRVARFSGDKFIMLVKDVKDEADARVVIDKLISAFRAPFMIEHEPYSLTVCIGISLYPENGQSIHVLVRNADNAMFAAKHAGHKDYHFYSRALSKDVQEKFKITNQFRDALLQNQFELHYQPQMNAADSTWLGVEALARWHHPKLGNIPPSIFIPIAEESGYITEIGLWVFRAACQQIKAWEHQGFHCPRMAINLSMKQFDNQALIDDLVSMIDDAKIEPQRIELEITENVFIKEPEKIIEHLNELKRIGLKIALDDFGTGYSCLSYLSQLPIDLIKIDRSFVSKIGSSHRNEGVVKSIISIAHNLGINVLAEGVETDEQKEFLLENGCANMQGYLFNKPLLADAVFSNFEHFATHQVGNLSHSANQPNT